MTKRNQEPTTAAHSQEVPTPSDHQREQTSRTPHMDSAALFNGTNRVFIHHRGEAYQLRETRQGKLILTK